MNNHLIVVTILSFISVLAIVVVVALKPANDMLIITAIIGFIGPVIGTVIAVMVRSVHTDINSRMTEFLELTKRSAIAEGRKEEKENPTPATVITPTAVLIVPENIK